MELSVYRMHYMALIRAEWMRLLVDARWRTNFRPEKLAALMARFMVLRVRTSPPSWRGGTTRNVSPPSRSWRSTPGTLRSACPLCGASPGVPARTPARTTTGPTVTAPSTSPRGSIMEDGYPLDRVPLLHPAAV
jgi:hypothetical protein